MHDAPSAAADQVARKHFFRANALREHHDDEAALREFQAAIEANPKFAEAYVNLGYLLQRGGRFAEAFDAYVMASTLQPHLPEAHLNLGTVCLKVGAIDNALSALRRAVALRPDWPEAHLLLGFALRSSDDLEGAVAANRRALELRPAYAEAWTNLANIYRAQNRIEEARVAAQRAVVLAPDSPQAHVNLAMALLVAGDLRGGWPHGEYRRLIEGGHARTIPGLLWTGRESLKGKSILLHAEQGFGDTVQFLRYVPQVVTLADEVHVEVQAALQTLARASLPACVRVLAVGEPLPRCDWQCALASLPLAFGTELATIPAKVPYLVVPSDSAASGRAAVGTDRATRIGIAWAGHPGHPNDHHRSIPLELFATLVRGLGDARFFSIKKEMPPADAAALAECPEVTNLAPELTDFGTTAGVIAQLDLVITVDTSVAHLAGALGRPTWILLPFSPDWRWMLDREDSPWYPTARLFRQPVLGDWSSVIARVRVELERLLRARG